MSQGIVPHAGEAVVMGFEPRTTLTHPHVVIIITAQSPDPAIHIAR